MNIIPKIYLILNKKLTFYFFLLLFLMVVGAVFEMIGITLVVPVIMSLLESSSFQFDLYLDFFLNFLGFKDRNIISLMSLILFFYLIKNLFIFFLIIFTNVFFYFLVYNHVATTIFSNYLNQSYKSLINYNLAILIRNVTSETYTFSNAIGQLLFLISELLVVLGIFTLMFYYEPHATLITLLATLIIAIIILFLSKKYYKKWGELRVFFSGVSNKTVIEALRAYKEIKIYKKTQHFFNAFKQSINMDAKMNMYLGIFAAAPRAWLETFGIVVLFLIVYINISLGNSVEKISELLVLFSFCAIRLLPSINRIINHFTYLRFFTPTAELMFEEIYLNKKKIFEEVNKNQVTINDFTKSILLKDISFNYNKVDKFNLKNINLEIKVNSFVGIEGKSGSGKSTLIDIILGLLVPNSGNLLIDDKIITNGYDVDGGWISYVPQSVFLIDDSIKANIALGVDEKNIDLKKLNQSISESGLDDFILTLDKGIDTFVGDSGVRLSGGQIQRIGIARALYNNPKLLILDESTSALDIETENEILNSISKLKGKITVIIISHRSNTLKICDQLYFINNN